MEDLNVKDDSPSEASTSNILANSRANVTLVDAFGRPRKFEEDGTEAALPPVDTPSATVKAPRRGRAGTPRCGSSIRSEMRFSSRRR
jgi:hypothetical protein